MSLPPSLLRNLLGLQELTFRLNTCALVHSTWAAAAVEASDRIEVRRWSWKQERFDSLAAWLRRHASASTLNTLALKTFGQWDAATALFVSVRRAHLCVSSWSCV